MTEHQVKMPWMLGESQKVPETPPDARQTDAPSQKRGPRMVGHQTVSVVETRLHEGWKRIQQARAGGQDVHEAEMRWAVMYARFAAALGVPFFGETLDRQGEGAWLGYADMMERERRALIQKQPS